MPQMLIIQPAVPKAPPQDPQPDSPGTKEQSQFSPHLENAISSNNSKQQVNDKVDKETLAEFDEELASLLKETPEAISLTPLYTESTKPITNSAITKSQQIQSSASLLQSVTVEIGNEPIKPSNSSGPNAVQSELPPATTDPVIVNPIKPSASKGQDALISQLQHIINNANETGTVSITRVERNTPPYSISSNIHGVTTTSFARTIEPISVATTTANSELTLNGLPGANIDGIAKTAVKPTQQLNGLRIDSQQQYYNAKINAQNSTENNQNFQGNQTGEELSQQTTGLNQQSGSHGAMEPTNTFSQVSAILQEATMQPLNESAKPIMLPSGTIVHEDEIIQQLSQKFQLSSKQMDSRINLKLHPAELGELKIDLSLKEGSIRANVVAQSQHTLEILEKNVPKLKSMLESQGFTVDEISITAESESVGDFDLFDRQLFSHNDYTPTPQKESREDEAIFTLDDNEFAAPVTSSGVNVKI